MLIGGFLDSFTLREYGWQTPIIWIHPVISIRSPPIPGVPTLINRAWATELPLVMLGIWKTRTSRKENFWVPLQVNKSNSIFQSCLEYSKNQIGIPSITSLRWWRTRRSVIGKSSFGGKIRKFERCNIILTTRKIVLDEFQVALDVFGLVILVHNKQK